MSPSKSREQILLFFTVHRTATSNQLAREFNLSGSDIRYHLTILLRQNIIETVPKSEDSQNPRGRPSRTFRLTTSQQPNNYQTLAKALLAFTRQTQSGSQDDLVNALADELAKEHPITKNLAKRLTNALQQLNQQNYVANWEARSQGPRITFHHCPYAAIWPEFPTLCEVDRRLLERLVASPVVQISTIQSNPGLHAVCLFQVVNTVLPAVGNLTGS